MRGRVDRFRTPSPAVSVAVDDVKMATMVTVMVTMMVLDDGGVCRSVPCHKALVKARLRRVQLQPRLFSGFSDAEWICRRA